MPKQDGSCQLARLLCLQSCIPRPVDLDGDGVISELSLSPDSTLRIAHEDVLLDDHATTVDELPRAMNGSRITVLDIAVLFVDFQASGLTIDGITVVTSTF